MEMSAIGAKNVANLIAQKRRKLNNVDERKSMKNSDELW